MIENTTTFFDFFGSDKVSPRKEEVIDLYCTVWASADMEGRVSGRCSELSMCVSNERAWSQFLLCTPRSHREPP